MDQKALDGDASHLVAAAAATSLVEMSADIQAKYDTLRSVGEECVSECELKALLVKKVGELGGRFNLYDGFEPSGRVHIAQGAFKANNVNKCTSSGGVFIFWVADWYCFLLVYFLCSLFFDLRVDVSECAQHHAGSRL